jgi:hypothetical protein
MTVEERLAVLEQKMTFFNYVTCKDGATGVMTMGRFGVMSDYWMKDNPEGQTSAFTVGTANDDWAAFIENETPSANKPIYGLKVGVYTVNGNVNTAIVAEANNSSVANIVIRAMGQGIQLAESVVSFVMGKLSNLPGLKQLWP